MSEIADSLRARYAEDAAAVRASWNRDGITSERYHGTPIDPARLLADLDAEERLLNTILADPHASVRPGGSTEIYCAADGDPGEPCECGRDARVNKFLHLLAQPFAGHPDHKGDEWAP